MKKLSPKAFTFYKFLIVILLAMTISAFSSAGNFVVPIIAIALGIAAMLFLRKSSGLKLSDERVEKVGGKAARWALTILVYLIVLIGLPMTVMGKYDPELYFAGSILNYLAMIGVFLYSIFFHIFNKRGE